MSNKNGLFRVKIEFENIPITDVQVHGIKGFNDTVKAVKQKFKGMK